MRVLVVDDDTVFCTVTKRKLAGLAADVTETYDGLSAWNIAQTNHFDLALVDLGLPGLDGLSLIEHIRQHPKTRHMPIIVITGRDDKDTINAAFAAGATLFLTKPINWSLIEYQIRCVMRMTVSEQELRHVHQRLRASNRVKDTVIGRLNHSLQPIAHELRVLANGMIHLANTHCKPDAIDARATVMIDRIERLEAGLSNMTAFAGSVSGELELNHVPTHLRDLIASFAPAALHRATTRDVNFRVELPASDIAIMCDTEQLSRAIANITDNAVRYAPNGSRVTLTVRLLEDRSLYISVDDEGCGIAPGRLVQLLSPHIETAGGGQSNAELAGMGLVVAKHIIEAHGGILEVHSAPQRGTTAALHIPADRVSCVEPNEIHDGQQWPDEMHAKLTA
ncbi:MAG: hybrid sensor histidine kinase/response regulator [Hyphomicrobiaceae bacterium]|nr:hybrid sensor histidine kinase/response regulator [Hyphomicrobiaceae bacterium]